MVKSISTIYISSEILQLAKQKGLNISDICEEALKLSVNQELNHGKVEGALGLFLNTQAEKKKDIEYIRKLSTKRDERFHSVLKAFALKHNLQLHEAIKEVGL